MWNKIEKTLVIGGWIILALIFTGSVYAAIMGIA